MDFFEHYFSVRYGDIVVLLYHEDMRHVVDLLNNKNKHKTLKVFLEYCFMIDVKVLLQGIKGEKTKGLKAAQKTVNSCGIAMTEEQIRQMQEASFRHCMQYVFAPQIKGAPVLENADGELQIEDILALKPDLCLVAWKDNVEPLEKAGLCVVYVNWTNGDELKEAVTLLGDILGKEDVAAQYCKFFDDTVARAEKLSAGISDDQRRTALYGSPVSMKNPHKISEWWIKEAGGISVTEEMHAAAEGESIEFSMEDLLAWNPDVMFLSGNDRDTLLSDTNYASLKAVQNDELYRVPTVGHSWGNRSTEQPLVILWGMNKLYPDLYSKEDLAKDIADFYSTFFKCDLTEEQIAKIIG